MKNIADTELKEKIRQIRIDCADMFYRSGHGHFGGSFSCAELVGTLYFRFLNVKPQNPEWEDRDRFIISKGHGAPSVYSALCQLGYFPRQYIEEYETLGANLSTHPNMLKVPGIDLSSGSLGHGLSVGAGMAMSAKMKNKSYRTYVVVGDGELNEGMVWEAAMCAGHFKLDNLILLVDRNGLCVSGSTEQVMALEPLREKWQAFGWDVYEVDGHDPQAITLALQSAQISESGRPKCIIAKTIKGKGVSFMENEKTWHGHSVDHDQYEQIMKELRA